MLRPDSYLPGRSHSSAPKNCHYTSISPTHWARQICTAQSSSLLKESSHFLLSPRERNGVLLSWLSSSHYLSKLTSNQTTKQTVPLNPCASKTSPRHLALTIREPYQLLEQLQPANYSPMNAHLYPPTLKRPLLLDGSHLHLWLCAKQPECIKVLAIPRSNLHVTDPQQTHYGPPVDPVPIYVRFICAAPPSIPRWWPTPHHYALRTTPKPCLFTTGVRPILFAALPYSPLQRVLSLTSWTYSLYLKQSTILHGYNFRLPKYTAPQLPMHSIFDPLINPERTTSSHESSIADSQCIYTYYLLCPAYPLDLRCYPD